MAPSMTRLISLLTLAAGLVPSGAWAAGDKGECLTAYRRANGRYMRKVGTPRLGQTGALRAVQVVAGSFAGLKLVSRSYLAATISTGVTTATIAAEFYVKSTARVRGDEAVIVEKQKIIKEMDAAVVYQSYRDAEDGAIDSEAGGILLEALDADPRDQPAVLKFFVDEMKSGKLCERGATKPFDEVTGILRQAAARERAT